MKTAGRKVTSLESTFIHSNLNIYSIMGILAKIIKISLPAGAIYWTVDNELWSAGTGSKEAEKRLERQRKSIDDALNQINQWRLSNVDPLLKPYIETSKIPKLAIATPDFVQYWNCGVRMTIRSLADFDATKTFLKLVDLGRKLTETSPEQKSVEPKVSKSS